MEPPAAATTAAPRVYVPISHPDSPVPTYAVLQLLGISSPPDPSQASPLLPQVSAAMHLLPCSSPISSPSSRGPAKLCASSAESSNSSSSDEKERKLTAIKPSPMKKTGSSSALVNSCLSPASRRNGKAFPHGPTISITHTDKDTVIHTNSSNFREVVHRLTGAGSGDKGLSPLTTPSRTTTITIHSRAYADKDSLAASPMSRSSSSPLSPSVINQSCEDKIEKMDMAIQSGDKMDTNSVRKVALANPTKLLERRKSNKVLERLSTSCRNIPVLVPSPVTPLASDFDKIHLHVTPSSEGCPTPTICAPLTNPSTACQDAQAVQTISTAAVPSSEMKTPLLQLQNGSVLDLDSKGPVEEATHTIQGNALSLQDMESKSQRLLHKPSPTNPSKHVVMSGPGPSLALATSGGDVVPLDQPVDMQIEPEISTSDVMDADDGISNGASSPQAADSSVVRDEESVILKDGFFFHKQRPQHNDPTLLPLFPEAPRGL
ncbi:hypothetical protein KP509_27G016900 [Ceratopteris richardii]|uniref:VQ domain-containing protein n=1 Tax=Ceratopteris richardii TaxID=49495 RepID=A0A8T2RG03_CERRI|nr:hypothetical protein KP509_27G016900 [Ceratopteris richardii]